MLLPGAKTIDLVDNESQRKFRLSGSATDQSILGPIEREGGIWEPHLVRLMHRLIGPDDVCFDIGANIGVHSLIMAGLASRGRVYSFEPSSTNFAYLAQNLKDNNLVNVTAFPLGFSNSSESRLFHTFVDIPGASFASDISVTRDVDSLVLRSLGYGFPYTSEVVDFSTLDDWTAQYCTSSPRLVKIDVEGSESFVIEGGAAFLSRTKPFLISEINVKCLREHFGVAPEDYFKQLSRLYEHIYIISENFDLIRVHDFNSALESMTDSKYWMDVLCSPSEFT